MKFEFNMKSVSLQFELKLTQPLESGSIDLYGSTGKRYVNKALYVPGYGMVPCSRKLQDNFSNKPEDLMLVIADEQDTYVPVTSDIWITRTNIVGFLAA